MRKPPRESFQPGSVLWLEVQPSERIVELRRKLHSLGVFDLSLPHTEDFVPHMTITEGLSGPKVNNDLLRSLGPRIHDGTFNCEGVVHLLPDKDFRFHAEREILFRDG